jgi:raffinose/stachyose/melibiose transport system permease protein
MKKNRLEPGGRLWIWYVLPALLVYLVFMAYPLVDSVRLSFFSGGSAGRSFVGFGNYAALFTDPERSARFLNAFKNTWVFFLIHMVAQNCLGLLFAALLTQPGLRGSRVYQTIIFIPTTLAVLVTGYLWKLLLNPLWTSGALSAIGLSGLSRPWLGDESTALTAASLVSCWQWMGIPTMMFVAGLQGISEDLFEAAHIEGASGFDVFRHIKLPLVAPVAGIVTILTFVNNFNAFDIIVSMETANGAPGYSTDLIGTLFYRTGIAGQHPVGIPEPGMGAALATVTFIMLAAVSLGVLRFTRTKE